MKKKIYFENLDGIRFLCFLMVFLFHSFYTKIEHIKNSETYHFIKVDLFKNGNIGVNFFFVLSGFLITYLLIDEKKTNGQINLKKFWMRRILRIWPLFYFTVFFGFIIFPFIKQLFGQTPNETANPIYYISFLNNFDVLKNDPDASMLGSLWSVAIEEQFYLIWPLILFIIPLRKLWIPFTIIIISSLIFRAYYDSYILNEYHTLSCIGDMTTGAFGAWLISTSGKFRKTIETLNKTKTITIYLIFILIFFFRDEVLFYSYGIRIFERLFVAIIIMFIILEQTFSTNTLYKMSSFKQISKLGTISYGLYCLHFIGILIAITLTSKLELNTNIYLVILIETPLALFTTILISKISYTYFEKPFLNFKNKFSYIKK